MARAYRYAEGGGPMPLEIEALRHIDRFGAQAVYGRPLGYGEALRLMCAENVVQAYQSRAAYPDWTTWAQDNEQANRLLNRAAKAANDDEQA